MDQRELWVPAKLAVRAYAKDPTERNAVNVELAWERLREHNSMAIWRQMRRKRQEEDAATALRNQQTNGRARPGQTQRDVA